MIIWLTGLSGAGKSTLASGLAANLRNRGIYPMMIDGDELRKEFCSDLGFSMKDRQENVRRAGAIALLASSSQIMSICSLISPVRSERERIRKLAQSRLMPFLEVYVSAPLNICERRDSKGLYLKARTGMIQDFIGIDSPYEPPLNPDLVIATDNLSVEESVELLTSTVIRLL